MQHIHIPNHAHDMSDTDGLAPYIFVPHINTLKALVQMSLTGLVFLSVFCASGWFPDDEETKVGEGGSLLRALGPHIRIR